MVVRRRFTDIKGDENKMPSPRLASNEGYTNSVVDKCSPAHHAGFRSI